MYYIRLFTFPQSIFKGSDDPFLFIPNKTSLSCNEQDKDYFQS